MLSTLSAAAGAVPWGALIGAIVVAIVEVLVG